MARFIDVLTREGPVVVNCERIVKVVPHGVHASCLVLDNGDSIVVAAGIVKMAGLLVGGCDENP
jgi:hypothetical protein